MFARGMRLADMGREARLTNFSLLMTTPTRKRRVNWPMVIAAELVVLPAILAGVL